MLEEDVKVARGYIERANPRTGAGGSSRFVQIRSRTATNLDVFHGEQNSTGFIHHSKGLGLGVIAEATFEHFYHVLRL